MRAGTLYARSSPFNRPIPPNPAVDPNSEAMVRQIVAEIGEKGWAIATKEYTVPVFYARGATPRQDVTIRRTGKVARRVPIPPGAFPSPGTDGHMVVLDGRRGCEYDFWRAAKTPDGRWEAEWMNALPTDGSGVYPAGGGARASGFAAAAGLIRPRDFKTGQIDHALVFTVRSTRAGGPVPPATSSDGRSTFPGSIPEGARVQLDPALDLESLALPPWQLVIARALQRYGMYLGDTGGAVALFARHPDSAGRYRYPWGDRPYGYMSSSLASHLRVLKLAPQRPSLNRVVPNRCLTLR